MFQWTIIGAALAVGTVMAAGLVAKDVVKRKGKKVIKFISRKRKNRC